MTIEICMLYSKYLKVGEKYTGKQFATIIKPYNKIHAATIEKTKLIFEKIPKGIAIDYQE